MTKPSIYAGTLFFLGGLLSSCSLPLPKGGKMSIPSPHLGALLPKSVPSTPELSVTQPDAPVGPSSQSTSNSEAQTIVLAQPSKQTTTVVAADGAISTTVLDLPAGTRVEKKAEAHVDQKLNGASDAGVAVSAQLASFKPLQYLGCLLLLVGIATFTPWGAVITGGSKTVQVAIGVGAVVCLFGPVFFVGHETLIASVVVIGLGLYYFAHTHGVASGLLQTQQNGTKSTKDDAGN